LAEVGTTLHEPVYVKVGDRIRATTYRAMLERALRDFSLNQVEYEWSTIAMAMFLPPARSFYSSEGQEITFDLLADRLMRQHQPQGVCFGNHRLYALVVLLRIDEEHGPILEPATRESIVDYLAKQSALLVGSQHVDGYWDGDWATGQPTSQAEKSSGDKMIDRILATGHALEWWANVPPSLASRLHPPRSTLAAAGQWLVVTIDRLTPEQTDSYFTFLSHAGRALSLWRHHEPYEVVHANAPTAP
jgi:hypothetical protein